MTTTREDINPVTVKLAVVCAPQEVSEGYTKAYKKIAKKVKVAGFRPGHAPRHVVEQVVDKSTINDEAAETIVRDAVKRAFEEHKINPEPTVRPAVDVQKLDEEKNECEFTITVALPPIVKLGEYKGLKAEAPSTEVTDEEVDKQVEEFRKRKSTREAVTGRNAQSGDVAVVNIRIDGEKSEGKNFMSVIGSTFDELDKHLDGMAIEELKHVELTFPKNFQEKEWAGKKLKCIISVNSISAVKLPELDDEFAKTLKAQSLDELKKTVRTMMEEAKKQASREILADKLLDALLEKSKVEAPEGMYEQLAYRRLQETEQEQVKLGKTLPQFAEENGMTLQELIDNWKEKAKVHVMRALLIREVFAAEKMKIDPTDIQREVIEMAGEYGVSPEEVVQVLRRTQSGEELTFRAISRKVSDFLIDQAKLK
ncbi:MAG: trigger factor [Armatimonadetes bacterium]|nr:trigger factor [Armatimonadota bacterium]